MPAFVKPFEPAGCLIRRQSITRMAVLCDGQPKPAFQGKPSEKREFQDSGVTVMVVNDVHLISKHGTSAPTTVSLDVAAIAANLSFIDRPLKKAALPELRRFFESDGVRRLRVSSGSIGRPSSTGGISRRPRKLEQSRVPLGITYGARRFDSRRNNRPLPLRIAIRRRRLQHAGGSWCCAQIRSCSQEL